MKMNSYTVFLAICRTCPQVLASQKIQNLMLVSGAIHIALDSDGGFPLDARTLAVAADAMRLPLNFRASFALIRDLKAADVLRTDCTLERPRTRFSYWFLDELEQTQRIMQGEDENGRFGDFSNLKEYSSGILADEGKRLQQQDKNSLKDES